MIRPSTPDDAERLVALTEATGFFRPHEIEALRGVLDAYFEGEPSHACYTSEGEAGIDGYVYLGEAEMADRAWYIWWMAVDPPTQGRGIGRELLRSAEDEARRRGGRVMFIETSGLPSYEPTRRFYLKNGYDREAVLRDYYRDGDDLVTFRKRLGPAGGPT
jgi:ribosomal protein S18 acetylase RimI-like enzyme